MATNTAPSFTEHTAPSSGSTAGPYSISFTYINEDDVEVTVNGVLKTKTTHYTFASATTIQFTSGNNPPNSAAIKFQRDTDIGAKKVDFQDGSVLTETDLDSSTDQLLFGLQELSDDYVKRNGTQSLTGNLVFEGSTDDNNETTLAITNPTDDRTITLPDRSGTVITSGDTGTVTSTMITDGTIVNADVNASAAIDGTKISPNFGSQNVATTGNGSIGGTLGVTSNTTVGGTLGVTGASTFTGAIDANGGATIDNVQIGVTGDNEIDTASGNLTIDSAGGTTTIDDAVTVTGNATLQSTLGVTGNATVGGTLGVTGTTTASNITGGAIVTSGTSTSDTKVYSAKRAGEIFYGKNTVAEIQSGETWSSTDDKVATTAAIDARIIDFVDDVGGFNAIANETSFPATNPQGSAGQAALLSIAAVSTTLTPSSNVLTIANGAGTGNTVTINGVTPSTIPQGFGLIVESTSTLHTYNFHRLVPKATEVTTVASISSNVTTVAGISSDVTTVAGISSNVTAVAGNASNINSAVSNASNINSAVSNASNINSAVSNASNINTVAGSITNVNNVGGSITSVNTAASNLTSIANFGDQYQVASSNPSTDGGGNDLAAGDLYFNTTANELKVYTGSAWQGGVTASGNFAATTGNNFTGDNVYADGAKAIFGTGQDLKIHHSSNQSTIEEVNGSLNITSNGTLSFNPSGSNIVTLVGNSTKGSGQIKFNCEQNSHGIILKGPPHSAAANYTLTLPNSIVNNGFLKTDSSGNLSFATVNTDLSNDTTPQLGGNLDLNSNTINGTGNISISGNLSGNALTLNNNNLTINGTQPNISFVDSDGNPDYQIKINGGVFDIRDSTADASRFSISSSGNISVSGTVDGIDIAASDTLMRSVVASTGNLNNGVTATTQSANDNSTKVATTAYTDTAISNLVDSSPSALNTLNELAAALGDDANFSTTVTNSIATKFSKAGGDTITGDFTIASGTTNKNINVDVSDKVKFDDDLKATFGSSDDLQIYHDGSNSRINNTDTGTFLFDTAGEFQLRSTSTKKFIKAIQDGAVEVYHDNSKKFETTSTGVSVTGALVASGDVTAFSDITLKTDVNTINNALSTVGKLRGVTYKWKENNKSSIGVIAQEVEQIIPEVVHTSEHNGKEVKSVDYGKLVGVLIEAIKELKAEVEELNTFYIRR
tara:strand:- start:1373 stop:4903 length:3531 start_codon:yes stop_codon:yes gene_type:complete